MRVIISSAAVVLGLTAFTFACKQRGVRTKLLESGASAQDDNITPPEILSESQLDDEPGGLQVPAIID